MQEFKIPYAKRASDGLPIDAQCYNEEKDLTCYECQGALYFRRGCEKKRKDSGLVYSVRPHFYHSGTSSCRGESTEHLVAKDIVANFTKFDFLHRCETCNHDYHPLTTATYTTTKTEYRWHDPVDNRLFVPDVAYLDEHDIMKGVVEIHHTHQIPEEKIDAFNNTGIVWVEVDARHVIEQYNAKKNVARVQRSSSFSGQCKPCVIRIQEMKEEARLRMQREAREKEEAEKAKIEDLKRRDIERAEACKREKERVMALAEATKRKKAEAARKQAEKKKEEAIVNEKKRKEYYAKERENNEKRAKLDVMTPEHKEALLEKETHGHIEREYEERRKHLMAYHDMIMNARKKKRESQLSSAPTETPK